MRLGETFTFPQMEKPLKNSSLTPESSKTSAKTDMKCHNCSICSPNPFLQQVQKIFQGDPALENFEQKDETIFDALEESYTNKMKQVKECKEYATELITVVKTTGVNQKLTNDSKKSLFKC